MTMSCIKHGVRCLSKVNSNFNYLPTRKQNKQAIKYKIIWKHSWTNHLSEQSSMQMEFTQSIDEK